ncbi:MAG TPA: NUDIX domain-containing protein [Acidobacteriota bacterium]|nr:NUDIX domain-containing protein [Acidobacteriota bacterium]
MEPETKVTAAGGILERRGTAGIEIAVVHRRRYQHVDGSAGDWVLPKGKVEAGESIEEAALREVAEETGYAAQIVGPSFRLEYLVAGQPKAVCFIRMAALAVIGEVDASEVDTVCWLPPAQTIARLTYANERQMVAQVYGLDGDAG